MNKKIQKQMAIDDVIAFGLAFVFCFCFVITEAETRWVTVIVGIICGLVAGLRIYHIILLGRRDGKFHDPD